MVANAGGVSICTSPGSTQENLAMRTFPSATFVNFGSVNEFNIGLCNGDCDAAVDSLDQIVEGFVTEPACASKTLLPGVTIPPPSSGGDIGALTHRLLCD